METATPESITIETLVHAPVEKVWKLFTSPEHIIHWNNASADWHTPKAENDLKVGGSFLYRMEAKDKSFAFDFGGTYTQVKPHEYIEYKLGDHRVVQITFSANGDATKVVETFDAEKVNPVELQRNGWQAILDNFKTYTESFKG